jgi:DUF2934 family protein
MAKTAKSKSQPGDSAENLTPSTTEVDPSHDSQAARPTNEQIALRAYHIYLERGGTDGDPLDDWLQAERELTEGS